jgi:hypothetical protein
MSAPQTCLYIDYADARQLRLLILRTLAEVQVVNLTACHRIGLTARRPEMKEAIDGE